jgi:glucose-6-phosphate 1-dehydrogenase
MQHKVGFCIETIPADCGAVLFGGTGDLSARKILPAFFNLYKMKLLPRRFYLAACGRSALDTAAYRESVKEKLKKFCAPAGEAELDGFLKLVSYVRADYDSPDFFKDLAAELDRLDAVAGVFKRRFFYLATPPSSFLQIARRLKEAGLLDESSAPGAWARILIEKPYGYNLASARELDRELSLSAGERQVYRIDHYLMKETIQNILALRSVNNIFEGTWNGRYVDNVQFTVFEDLGVEGRADYFNAMGTARDMLSHIFQMAAVVAMELPASLGEAGFKAAKARFFASVRKLTEEDIIKNTVRGQYGPGVKKTGESLPAYREGAGVGPDSDTETFFAMKFFVDNERWRDVPFYVRAGKRMPGKKTRIVIEYKKCDGGIFGFAGVDYTNVLYMNIQPEESLILSLNTKHPGPRLCFTRRNIKLNYRQHTEEYEVPGDYERLLLDAMAGDQTLFVSSEDMNFMWNFITPVVELWRGRPELAPLVPYPSLSGGPKEAERLIKKDGRAWR